MVTEVASTRLPKEILREIDREAAARGIARSVYLADLIERGARGEPTPNLSGDLEALRVGLVNELREIRDSQRGLAQAMRDIQAALKARASVCGAASSSVPGTQLLDRLTFSTFFSEVLIKRISALLYRNPGELGQVVREAREEAQAEARLWRERLNDGDQNDRPSP